MLLPSEIKIPLCVKLAYGMAINVFFRQKGESI